MGDIVFWERLVYLMGLHRLSVGKLGTVLGIQLVDIYDYDKDWLSPSIEVLICIGDYLVGVVQKENTSSKAE